MSEAVHHPAHYGGANHIYEAIKVIEAWHVGFHLGNTLKYICRSTYANPAKQLEDLQKARWYLDRKIADLEASTRTSQPEPQPASIQKPKGEYTEVDQE